MRATRPTEKYSRTRRDSRERPAPDTRQPTTQDTDTMTFAEAIAALQAGHKIAMSSGSTFWLEHDAKGPVLMGEPAGYGKPIKHLVFSSEHFRQEQTWTIVDD